MTLLAMCKKVETSENELNNSEFCQVETIAVSDIKAHSALCSGRVQYKGQNVKKYGICFSINTQPTVNHNIAEIEALDSIGVFVSRLEGLEAQTEYYVRAFAVNETDTIYGVEKQFCTLSDSIIQYGDGVTDIDGNHYVSVIIGQQEWMASNLRSVHYNDGTSIPLVTESVDWKKLTTPAYCWYDNDSIKYSLKFGALYNWFTVATEKLCPAGWHVPSDEEWAILVQYAGGDTIAGRKLKSTTDWYEEGNGTNDYGFSMLPCGYRYDYDGLFHDQGKNAYGWSSTSKSASHAWYRYMRYSMDDVYQYSDRKGDGYGVRCIKDENSTKNKVY